MYYRNNNEIPLTASEHIKKNKTQSKMFVGKVTPGFVVGKEKLK